MLVIGDDDAAKTEGIKAQAIAKFVGTSLTTRSASIDDEQLTLPCLVVNSRHITGGNVIAKLLLAAAGHTLYPQAPYSPDKRYRSAQIDAWIDYSTNELRTRQVIAAEHLFAHPMAQYASVQELLTNSNDLCHYLSTTLSSHDCACRKAKKILPVS